MNWARAQSYFVSVWTVNDRQRAIELRDLGVNAIIHRRAGQDHQRAKDNAEPAAALRISTALQRIFAFTYDLVSRIVSLGQWRCWQT